MFVFQNIFWKRGGSDPRAPTSRLTLDPSLPKVSCPYHKLKLEKLKGVDKVSKICRYIKKNNPKIEFTPIKDEILVGTLPETSYCHFLKNYPLTHKPNIS